MSGGKDGHTLFHRIILATTMSSSKTAKKLAFKSQMYRVQCWSYQRTSHHSQHAKNQLIHKLIQQILGSHELNGHARF